VLVNVRLRMGKAAHGAATVIKNGIV
jgi:hypothetical protein